MDPFLSRTGPRSWRHAATRSWWEEGEPQARIPPGTNHSSEEPKVRKAAALVAVAGTTAALLGLAGASASPKSAHRQVLTMRLVATNGYFVDNDPSGQSGGDLFGSAGELRRHGHKIGRASSACTLVPPVGGQCQVTLIRRRGGRI
jgi:hypothetical protein